MSKKIIYVDMDDTSADFCGHPAIGGSPAKDVSPMYEVGFFESLPVIDGALSAIRALIRMGYDVHILTQPVAESAHSYQEKVRWIGKHFPELVGKIHMTQNKGLFIGGYLVDDNAKKWKEKFEANGGKFVEFRYNEYKHREMWEEIVRYFEEELKCLDSQ